MSKILIGIDKGNYSFTASTGQIQLTNIENISLNQLLLIVNSSKNDVIYSPVDSSRSATLIGNNLIQLNYSNVSGHSNSDLLQIYISEKNKDEFGLRSHNFDSFGRIRTSNPFIIFENSNIQSSNNDLMESLTANGASVTYISGESAVYLTTDTTSGSRAIREQHGYNYYHPGKTQQIFMTGVFGDYVDNNVQRIGYFNDNDGLFFEKNGTDNQIYIVERSSVNSTERKIPQSQWNFDTLNGTNDSSNPSGILLDTNKANIYTIDFQWLGVGQSNYGIIVGDKTYYVHKESHANLYDTVYTRTPQLPIRYENVNTGVTTASTTLIEICSSVNSEASIDTPNRYREYSTGPSPITIGTTLVPLFSIRLQTLINNITNIYKVYPIDITLFNMVTNQDAYYQIILQKYHMGQVVLGGTPTWTPLSNTTIEYSTNVTSTSGGILLGSGVVFRGGRGSTVQNQLSEKDFLSLNSIGDNSDVLHVLCRGIGGNVQMIGKIEFSELY